MNYDFEYQSDPNDYAYIDGDGSDGDDFEEYDDEYAYERTEVSGVSADETIECIISAWIDTLSQLYVVIVLCASFHVLSYVLNPETWRSAKLYTLQHILSATIGCIILYRVIDDLVYYAILSVAVFYALLCASHHICAFLYRRYERSVTANAQSGAHAPSSKRERCEKATGGGEHEHEQSQPNATASRSAFQLRCMSVIVGGLCFMMLLQCVVLDAVRWTRVRGVIMIQLMKAASLADMVDSQNSVQPAPVPPLANVVGYLLHCGSALFGPFIPYSFYLRTLRRTAFMPRALTWWLHFLYALAATAFSLTYSFCAVHFVFGCLGSLLFASALGAEPGENAFLTGFRDAQSFRFSHYFVCKFSELQLLLSGLTYDEPSDQSVAIEHRRDAFDRHQKPQGNSNRDREELVRHQRERNNSDSSTSTTTAPTPQSRVSQRTVASGRQSGSAYKAESTAGSQDSKVKRKHVRDAFDFDVHTANMLKVELPRSMIDIANNWNIPMHIWLRQYVFLPLRTRFHMPIAVLGTYAVSSLLHGFNFQLSAVLLSIGLLSYVEFVFRKKFSDVFSACIHVRRCPDDCSRHRFKNSNLYVKLTNLAFLLLNWLHLMFLGMMFDSDESQTEGYSMQHTLEKWYSVYFCSYIIAALMFVVNLIV